MDLPSTTSTCAVPVNGGQEEHDEEHAGAGHCDAAAAAAAFFALAAWWRCSGCFLRCFAVCCDCDDGCGAGRGLFIFEDRVAIFRGGRFPLGAPSSLCRVSRGRA